MERWINDIEPSNREVVRLHVPSILHGSHALPHGFMLRCLQLCASIVVRSVFTSDRGLVCVGLLVMDGGSLEPKMIAM